MKARTTMLCLPFVSLGFLLSLSIGHSKENFTVEKWPASMNLTFHETSTWGDAKITSDFKHLFETKEITLNATATKGSIQWACFAKRDTQRYSFKASSHINSLPKQNANFATWRDMLGLPEVAEAGSHREGVIFYRWHLWNGKRGTELELVEVTLGRRQVTEEVVFGVIRKTGTKDNK